MEKISIIVPVYKVEPYLHQCVDSILNQTYTNYELILVDDGSPDNCGTICDEYAAKDGRITVIHQENGGLSAARNTGIDWVFENSDSQWITFVDSDDALSPIMLETLLQAVGEYQADIAITHPAAFFEDTQLEREGKFVGEVFCFSGKSLLESFYNGEDKLSVVTWGKLIKRNLFMNLRFPAGKIHEDEATTPILLFHANKVVVIRSWLYFYRQRKGSIMHSAFSVKRFDHIDALSSCASYFKANDGGKIARMAKWYFKKMLARKTFTARQEGIYNQLPAKYRMSVIRAGSIIFVDSLRSGGMKYVKERICNLIRQMKR